MTASLSWIPLFKSCQVRFIVNFSSYTSHTEELKVQFLLSHSHAVHITRYTLHYNCYTLHSARPGAAPLQSSLELEVHVDKTRCYC